MDARAHFGNVIVAMVTPFTADGEVDLAAAERVATHLVDSGCDGVLVSGTTGESPTTHSGEKVDLIRVVRSAVGDRAKVMAGAGSNHTDHAVRMAEQAAEAGADSVLVVSPYYNRPSQEGVAAHIEAVASAADLPVMVYDIPGRTGVAVGPECSARIARHPNVVAFKDATGNPVAGSRRGREVEMAVYSGDDALNLSFLAHGAVGVVSVVGHVAADRYRRMVDAMTPDEGGRVDLATALALHNELA
nr:4-hydroxy-tetrahydrodipicolinate synthase [Actinomycetales bacterium]